MSEQLTICIGACNEQWRIGQTLRSIERFMKRFPLAIKEVIIVDDGSKDATSERILSYWGKIPLQLHILEVNCGKWTALSFAIDCAKTDAVLLMDADGSASVWELSKLPLMDILESKEMVFGSRFMEGASVEGKSIFRNLMSIIYRLYSHIWFWIGGGGLSVDDFQAPFKLIYKSKLRRSLQKRRFAGDIDLLLALDQRSDVRNHPLEFVHRRGSSIRSASIFQMMIETVKVVLQHRNMYSKGMVRKVISEDHNIFK
jgi:glycosyltransferase involved in cell wall biosynthesis